MATDTGATITAYWGDNSTSQSSFALEPWDARWENRAHGLGGTWTCEMKRFEITEQERPDSFFLTWSGAPAILAASLFAVELRYSPSGAKKPIVWRYPVLRQVQGADGSVDFRGVVPTHLWKSTSLKPTSVTLFVRESGNVGPLQAPLRESAGNFDSYSRNNVAFIFPAVSKVLWASSSDLIKASEYFALMLGSSGFTEVEDKIGAPELEQELLDAAKQSSEEGAIASEVVKVGGKRKRTDESDGAAASAGAAAHSRNEEQDVRIFEDSDDEDAPPASSTIPPSIHRIVIRDASYKTYRATLHYLATGKISFSHLSSLYLSSTRPPAPSSSSTEVLPTSPKSIYRLADFLSLRDLKSRAFASIETQLCANNALIELLSDLSADYDDVREACTAAVLRNWPALVENGEIEELGRKVVAGELEERKAKIAWQLMSRLKPAA